MKYKKISLISKTAYWGRHSKLFTNCHVLWDTLYIQYCSYINMTPIVGQTAGPNGLTFFTENPMGFTDKRSNYTGSNDKGSNDKGSKVRQRVKRQKVKMIKIFFIWIIGNSQPSYQFCTWILYVRHGYNWPYSRSTRPPSLS